MGELFTIQRHTRIDKEFEIKYGSGWPAIRLKVDYDDVDQKEVDRLARRIVDVLNENWDKFRP